MLILIAFLSVALTMPDYDALPSAYTVAEAAELLKVSPRTIYQLIHDGELRAVKVGHSRRIPREVVAEILNPLDPQDS